MTSVHTLGLKWWGPGLASLLLNNTERRIFLFPFLGANLIIRNDLLLLLLLLNFAVGLWLVFYGAIDTHAAFKRALGLKVVGWQMFLVDRSRSAVTVSDFVIMFVIFMAIVLRLLSNIIFINKTLLDLLNISYKLFIALILPNCGNSALLLQKLLIAIQLSFQLDLTVVILGCL